MKCLLLAFEKSLQRPITGFRLVDGVLLSCILQQARHWWFFIAKKLIKERAAKDQKGSG